MEPKIIFEDDSILVLDKPSGWIVNEADTTGNTSVVQTWLKKNFKHPLIGDREKRDGIVHRLDKETSGVLIVAKTSEAFENLQEQFKERKVEKTYTALVHGKVIPGGEIKATVGRLPWRRDRFGVLPGGREAITKYKVLSDFQLKSQTDKPKNFKPKTEYSLLELYPKTGRTHQIRIHLKYLGHPIVSDEFYAGRKTARSDRKWCPRLFLHASGISFEHPKTDKKLYFNSRLSSDLSKVLASLEMTPETP